MESKRFEDVSFFARLGLAMRLVFNSAFAREVFAGLKALEVKPAPVAPKAPAPTLAPERVHASGLILLSALQREGRLIDFVQQDVVGFSDEEVGTAARVVHAGCKKTIAQYFDFEPAIRDEEGATITVPKSFDAQRIRLTGNVAGQPPFKGTVRHHGWIVREIRLPVLQDSLDPRNVAPAEVELP